MTVKIKEAILLLTAALCIQGCGGAKNSADNVKPKPIIVFEDKDTAISFDGVENENVTISEDEAGDGYNSELADKHVKLTLESEGRDVFLPRDDGQQDYRYSPCIMLDDNGGIDAWYSAPGDGEDEYDWVTYRHSDDGGATWTDERVVISPSPNTPDALSICDPDAFYYDGYYYLGYTSTINKNEKGLCNSVFIARAEKPEGPYLKWNGSGWGGMPVPIVYFNGLELGWGCGEPSFVVIDDTLYLYSTRDSFTTSLERLRVTEIRTADLTEPDWPASFTLKGHTVLLDDPEDDGYVYDDSDSWDVAYLDESHKFIAVCTNRRFKDDSCLLYFESDDGIDFERVSEINRHVITKCHNCAIMSDRNGHIKKHDPVLLGYSYAGSDNSKWGVWATRLAPATIEYTDEPDRSDDDGSNVKRPIKYKNVKENVAPMMLSTDKLVYTGTVGGGPFDIRYYLRDNYRGERFIGKTGVSVESYDTSIVTANSAGEIIPKAEGMTVATVAYSGLRRDICLCVMPSKTYNPGKLNGFFPIVSDYKIKMDEKFIVKVRPMAVFEGYEMHELTNEEIIRYGVSFSSSDSSVFSVSGDGTITPHAPGKASIKVRSAGGEGYEINVEVKQQS